MTGKQRLVPLAALLIAGAFCWPLPLTGQVPAVPDTLSPELQKLFDRGIEAAKQEEYGLAARYFTEVQEKAPVSSSPRVLFNLGLAHSKAGHELAGAAWLDAFLLADPQSPNVAAVRGEIERLKGATRAKIKLIFQDAVAKVQTVPEQNRSQVLYGISYMQASLGDIDGALVTARIRDTNAGPDGLWVDYAKKLVELGKMQKAKEAIAHAVPGGPANDEINNTHVAICEKLVALGDCPGARNAAQFIPDAAKREKVLRKIRATVLQNLVEKNAAAHDFDPIPIEELLPLLEEDGFMAHTDQMRLLVEVAEKQWQAGDIAGAKSSFTRAQQTALNEKASGAQSSDLAEVARSELNLGYVDGAKQTAEMILACGEPVSHNDIFSENSEGRKVIPYGDAAAACAILGKYDQAIEMAEKIWDEAFDPCGRDEAFGQIVSILGSSGKIGKARKTAQRAAEQLLTWDEWEKQGKKEPYVITGGVTEKHLAEVLSKNGDFKEAMDVLRSEKSDAYGLNYSMEQIVEELLKKGRIDDALEAAGVLAAKNNTRANGNSFDKGYANILVRILIARADAGDLTAAGQTLALVPSSNQYRQLVVRAFAQSLEKAGNHQASVNVINRIAVDSCIGFSVKLSQDKTVVDLAASLTSQAQGASADAMVTNLSNKAFSLGTLLNDLEDLEEILLYRKDNGSKEPGK